MKSEQGQEVYAKYWLNDSHITYPGRTVLMYVDCVKKDQDVPQLYRYLTGIVRELNYTPSHTVKMGSF
jgi:hypothetical protein